MEGSNADISVEEISSCIGAIYDCATDPSAWPKAIETVASLVSGKNGVLIALDPLASEAQFHASWNVDPADMRVFSEEFAADNPLIPAFNRYPVDEPYNIGSVMPIEAWEASRTHREFGQPRGFRDSLGVTVIKTNGYLASLSIATSDEFPYTSARELNLMRLIAPHARRALSISKLVDMQTLEVGRLEAMLDALAPGIFLLDGKSALIHANAAGREMLESQSPFALRQGRLEPRGKVGAAALAQALGGGAAAGGNPPGPATYGLLDPNGAPVFVHLLPIRAGEGARWLGGAASIALFVTARSRMPILGRDAWTGAFGLTASEARTLELLVQGLTPAEIAEQISAALPTVRTHLARLFEKTGTSRQAELIALAASLEPPTRRA